MSWQLISPKTVRQIELGLLLVSFIWGMDYILPPTENVGVLNFVEKAAPLELWGTFLVLGAVMGFFGNYWIQHGKCITLMKHGSWKWVFPTWAFSWTSHVLLAGIFVALSVGALGSVLDNTDGIYGYRTPANWAFLAALHIAFSKRVADDE